MQRARIWTAIFAILFASGLSLRRCLLPQANARVWDPEALSSLHFTADSLPGAPAGADVALAALIRATAADTDEAKTRMVYPAEGAVFPPDFAPPTFLWDRPSDTVDAWLLRFDFPQSPGHKTLFAVAPNRPPRRLVIDREAVSETNVLPEARPEAWWTPPEAMWERVKREAAGKATSLSVHGFRLGNTDGTVTHGSLRFAISIDSVKAPIFYRDVPVMPSRNTSGNVMPLAPAAVPLIAWRLRDVSRPAGRKVLGEMPTCANCHSFSDDGKFLGMDIEGPQLDKGAYGVAAVERKTVFDRGDVMSWNYGFKGKPRGSKTIGFLSRISPDGGRVITTVNEKVFVVNYLDYRFLQAFYPTRGVLAVHTRKDNSIELLPGADNAEFVHCDPVWSPDGKWIVFARAKARDPFVDGAPLPKYAGAPEETPIQYDLYRIPFNGGRGGKPEAVAGASGNGMSNTFPKISPDGKWIVFVKCRNGQLMRPDSRLWIVPFAGGEAREMECNTPRMNSWHSFSPSGRWLVFSSKANTYYTQMFLTHLDTAGRSSAPILIEGATADNRAVNLPEFANIRPEEIDTIEVPATRHFKYMLEATRAMDRGEQTEAEAQMRQAVAASGDDLKFRANALINLGGMVMQPAEAERFIREAIAIDSTYSAAYVNLGVALQNQGKHAEAAQALGKAISMDRENHFAMVRLARLLISPDAPGVRDARRAVKLAETANTLTGFNKISVLETLAQAKSETGDFEGAIKVATKAAMLARERGVANQAARLESDAENYRKKIPFTKF